MLVSLRSPHTITTYDFGAEPDGSLYIAMELSPGRSLAQVFHAEGALDWRRVLHILAGLCDSLGEAHAMGVIHRDLRPENILLEMRPTARDFVKVTDFGLSKVIDESNSPSPTPVGQHIGTIDYASPEQLLSRPLDGRAISTRSAFSATCWSPATTRSARRAASAIRQRAHQDGAAARVDAQARHPAGRRRDPRSLPREGSGAPLPRRDRARGDDQARARGGPGQHGRYDPERSG